MGPIKNFISRLQNADDATKKLWLIILSAAAMIIVVGLWLVSLNYKVKSGIALPASPDTVEVAQKKAGIKEIMAAGLKSIASALKGKLPDGREFNVNSQERNFIVDGLEPISKTNLP